MYWVSFCGWQVDIGLVATLIGGIISIISLIIYIFHRKRDKRAEKIRDMQTQANFDRIFQYIDGLPQAKKEVKEPFEAAREALADYELDRAMMHLQLALKKADEPEQRTALLIIMGHAECNRGNYDSAMRDFEEALKIAKKSKDLAGQCWALNGLASIHYHTGELDKAERYHLEAIEIARFGNFDRAKQSLSANLCNIGIVLKDKGHLEGALRSYQEALEIERRIGNPQGEASDLGNIGNVLFEQGDLEGALRSHQEALKIHRRIGDPLGEAIDLGNIGLLLMDKGYLDEALLQHQEALDIHRRIGNPKGEAIVLGNIGLLLKDKGDLEGALRYMEQALVIFKKLGMPREINAVENNIKKVKDMMGKT